jgi:hypothetical protein
VPAQYLALTAAPRPQYVGTAFALLTTFPNKELVEEGQTLEVLCADRGAVQCSGLQEAGLLGAAVLQRLK